MNGNIIMKMKKKIHKLYYKLKIKFILMNNIIMILYKVILMEKQLQLFNHVKKLFHKDSGCMILIAKLNKVKVYILYYQKLLYQFLIIGTMMI